MVESKIRAGPVASALVALSKLCHLSPGLARGSAPLLLEILFSHSPRPVVCPLLAQGTVSPLSQKAGPVLQMARLEDPDH